MNILMVERTFPWPESSGTSIRVANIVRALAGLGEVDFFLLSNGATPKRTQVPKGEPIARMSRAPRSMRVDRGRSLPSRQLWWLMRESLPFSLARRDYSGVHSAFRAWARPQYDLVWVGRPHAYMAMNGLIEAPTIVDFDDLEDRKIEAWLDIASHAKRMSASAAHAASPVTPLRRLGSRFVNGTNMRRWRALEHRIAAAVEAVVICSEEDRRQLGVSNGVVVPNAYVPPDQPVGRVNPRRPGTVLLVGAFGYGPNIDGARFLVKEVLPLVRTRLPDTRVRLVGENDHRIEDLGLVDGVSLSGRVPDITVELARADIVAVPIRFGSGTRVKILEAFAHRIPVVSTNLGREGLDTTHGRHLLAADGAHAFATACIELLEDVALRSRLTQSAHALYWSRYRWEVVSHTVRGVAQAIACGKGSGLEVARSTPRGHHAPSVAR